VPAVFSANKNKKSSYLSLLRCTVILVIVTLSYIAYKD